MLLKSSMLALVLLMLTLMLAGSARTRAYRYVLGVAPPGLDSAALDSDCARAGRDVLPAPCPGRWGRCASAGCSRLPAACLLLALLLPAARCPPARLAARLPLQCARLPSTRRTVLVIPLAAKGAAPPRPAGPGSLQARLPPRVPGRLVDGAGRQGDGPPAAASSPASARLGPWVPPATRICPSPTRATPRPRRAFFPSSVASPPSPPTRRLASPRRATLPRARQASPPPPVAAGTSGLRPWAPPPRRSASTLAFSGRRHGKLPEAGKGWRG